MSQAKPSDRVLCNIRIYPVVTKKQEKQGSQNPDQNSLQVKKEDRFYAILYHAAFFVKVRLIPFLSVANQNLQYESAGSKDNIADLIRGIDKATLV